MQRLSVTVTLGAVCLLSTVQCQTEQQTIRVQQAEVSKKKTEENVVADTDQFEENRAEIVHPHVILPGVSYLNKLRHHARHQARKTHLRMTSVPHMLYKNRRMNPIRNHLEVKNDRKMMKPKGSYSKFRHS